MGRTLKRVPLDFDWPVNKTWIGYLNPHEGPDDCAHCDGSGLTAKAKHISDQWYGKSAFFPLEYGATPLTVDHPSIVSFARRQIESNPGFYGSDERAVLRRCRELFDLFKGQWCHHLIQADVDALVAKGRLRDLAAPTADEVNAWSVGGFGHDAINAGVCLEARCAREGIPCLCLACSGDGEKWPDAESKARYESWSKTEPPIGGGYQLWETTSEGSPVSPVFASMESLCDWCADNATTFGSFKTSADQWRKMLDANFVHHTQGNAIFI